MEAENKSLDYKRSIYVVKDISPGEKFSKNNASYKEYFEIMNMIAEFYHQNLSVSPSAGKLILFPPFWTHKHRGTEVLSGKKYIATTWVVFA